MVHTGIPDKTNYKMVPLVELSVPLIIRHGHPHGCMCGYPRKWPRGEDILIDVRTL